MQSHLSVQPGSFFPYPALQKAAVPQEQSLPIPSNSIYSNDIGPKLDKIQAALDQQKATLALFQSDWSKIVLQRMKSDAMLRVALAMNLTAIFLYTVISRHSKFFERNRKALAAFSIGTGMAILLTDFLTYKKVKGFLTTKAFLTKQTN